MRSTHCFTQITQNFKLTAKLKQNFLSKLVGCIEMNKHNTPNKLAMTMLASPGNSICRLNPKVRRHIFYFACFQFFVCIRTVSDLFLPIRIRFGWGSHEFKSVSGQIFHFKTQTVRIRIIIFADRFRRYSKIGLRKGLEFTQHRIE